MLHYTSGTTSYSLFWQAIFQVNFFAQLRLRIIFFIVLCLPTFISVVFDVNVTRVVCILSTTNESKEGSDVMRHNRPQRV